MSSLSENKEDNIFLETEAFPQHLCYSWFHMCVVFCTGLGIPAVFEHSLWRVRVWVWDFQNCAIPQDLRFLRRVWVLVSRNARRSTLTKLLRFAEQTMWFNHHLSHILVLTWSSLRGLNSNLRLSEACSWRCTILHPFGSKIEYQQPITATTMVTLITCYGFNPSGACRAQVYSTLE